jgi:hypothetical protein
LFAHRIPIIVFGQSGAVWRSRWHGLLILRYTCNDLILNFVKQNKRPTTREINTHWISEGRSGKADNTLSILVNAGKLKRTPLGGGEKGSRYSLA